MWVEAPGDTDDVCATIEVARSVPVPIAWGEHYKKLSALIDILAPRIIDIVQLEQPSHRAP